MEITDNGSLQKAKLFVSGAGKGAIFFERIASREEITAR
jgi:hypothetical protein